MYVIDIDPKPSPRMVRSDKWAKRKVVTDYFTWRDAFILLCKKAGYMTLKDELCVIFLIGMPASWSKKKKEAMNNRPHQQRPDWDNLAKSIQDAWGVDDGYVYAGHCEKYWGYSGKIILFDAMDEMLNFVKK